MVVIAVAIGEKKNICCCGLKMWTRVIGWLGLIGCLVAAFVGVTTIGAGEANGAQEKGDWRIIVTIWAFTLLGVLIHVLLLLGNETEKARFFFPWLISSLIAMGLSAIVVFRLTIKGGGFPCVLTLPGLLAMSPFFLFAVHQRYNEIHENSRSDRQWSTVNIVEVQP